MCRSPAVAVADAKKDGGHDEEDATADGGDDGHHHGGHHQALVPASCTPDGQPSRDEEKDRRPDSSANEETTDQ